MASNVYYRGGPSLKPRTIDLSFDLATGLLRPHRGISIMDWPVGLERFGGAFMLTQIPANLQIVKTGRDPHQYELSPSAPMTQADYEAALAQVVLVRV